MSDSGDRTGLRDKRRLAVLERDAALARVGKARRWMITATAALTAGIAALVSAVTPGRSGAATQVSRPVHAASSSPTAQQFPPPAGPGALGLQGPAQPPVAAASQPAVPAPAPAAGGGAVSGGS